MKTIVDNYMPHRMHCRMTISSLPTLEQGMPVGYREGSCFKIPVQNHSGFVSCRCFKSYSINNSSDGTILYYRRR